MWNYNEKDLIEEVGGNGKNYLQVSSALVCKIDEIEDKDYSGHKNIILKVTPEGYEQTTIYVMYEHAEGKDMSFNTRRLNQLMMLLKVKTPEELLTKAVGQNVGMFLQAKLSTNKDFINFNLDGVFDAKTNKTTKELTEKTKAETFDKMVAKYAKQPKLERVTVKSQTASVVEDDSDSFPFN